MMYTVQMMHNKYKKFYINDVTSFSVLFLFGCVVKLIWRTKQRVMELNFLLNGLHFDSRPYSCSSQLTGRNMYDFVHNLVNCRLFPVLYYYTT
jgi:hypothetical protein